MRAVARRLGTGAATLLLTCGVAAADPILLTTGGGLLTAPFQFNGTFSFDQFTAHAQTLALFGTGTASLVLRQNTFGDVDPSQTFFSVTSARFEFSPAEVGATPEPASMLLLGTGIVGLAARRRLAHKSE